MKSRRLNLKELIKALRGQLSPSEMGPGELKFLSIVGLMAKQRVKETHAISILMVLVTILLVSANYFVTGSVPRGIVFVSAAFLLLLNLGCAVFLYRVRQDFYGNNAGEVREIVEFIYKHPELFNGGSGGGGGGSRLRIFPVRHDTHVNENSVVGPGIKHA